MKIEDAIEEILEAEDRRARRGDKEPMVIVVSRKLFYSFPEEFTKGNPLDAGFSIRGHRVIVTHATESMSLSIIPESVLASIVVDIRGEIHSAIDRSIHDRLDRASKRT